jgi:hypothetical protein
MTTTDIIKFMGLKKIISLLLFLSISLFSFSQQEAIISGLVTDIKTKEPLVGATIMLEGTTAGTVTDFDGIYRLEHVKPGTYTIRCSFISYETILMEKVTVSPKQNLEINFALKESTVEIEDVKVVAKANRESESMLLLDQKNATIGRESIGARQLSTQGVSDAASAATKFTGVTKQEGTKTLNIRGLGDRYNTTTLNGLPLPSNDAENKNLDLELFASDVIEYISVEKVFTPAMQGDFAGANINIVSKKHEGEDFLKLGLKTGMNTQAVGADKFYLEDGPGFLGFYSESTPTSLSPYSIFKNSWNPKVQTVYPHTGLSFSGGKSFKLTNSSLTAFATVAFENEYKYSDLFEGKYNADGERKKEFDGEQYNYQTQTTGLLNLSYSRPKSSYYLNSILMNTSDESLKNFGNAYVRDVAENDGLIRRFEFIRTTALVNQMLGEHTINDKMDLKWGLAYNHILNSIPDRRHNTLNHENDNEPDKLYFATNDHANNNRYFHELKEDEFAANVNLGYQFGEPINEQYSRGKLTIGYSGKYKERTFIATEFYHEIITNQAIDPEGLDIDAYFNNENLQNGYFKVRTASPDLIIPSTYDGEQLINAGIVNVDYNLTSKLLVSAGVRAENVRQKIKFNTTLRSGEEEFTEFNLFPSLAFKYGLNDKTNLRLSSGITYTLPQFKETAPFLFEGTTDATFGNEFLYPSKAYNMDLKWEYFPKSSELFSATVFGKYISDPINKFVMASSSNEFTYGNTGDWAKLYGLEIEARKDLLSISDGTKSSRMSLWGNLTLMHTNQELDNEKIDEETDYVYSDFDKTEEELQGAASFIANASLSYTRQWNQSYSLTPAVVYNYTSDRLFLIGYSEVGNQVDKAFHSLDFVLTSKLKRFGISFSAKNILNPAMERYQENAHDILVRSYKNGTKISIGLSYEF